VAAAVVAIGAGINAIRQGSIKAAEESAKALKEQNDEADRLAMTMANIPPDIQRMNAQLQASAEIGKTSFATIKDAAKGGLQDSIRDFLSGAENYAEVLRTKLREGILNAVIDAVVSRAMTSQFDALISNIVDTFVSGTVQGSEILLRDLEEKLIRTAEGAAQVTQTVVRALGMTDTEIGRMADRATSSAKKLRDEGSEAALKYRQTSLLSQLQSFINRGDTSSPGYRRLLDAANQASRDVTGLATGGLVTGPTLARMGEGGRNEAVLPLNENVYRQIGQGIASARGGGGAGAQVVVQYYGSGKWTREDAQGLGKLLVSELRAMGVKA